VRVTRTNQRVDRRSVGVSDVAENALGLLHPETRELGDDVLRRVEKVGVLRAADTVRDVRQVVPHEKERSAGSKRGRGPPEDIAPLDRVDLKVEDEHEIEGVDLRRVREEVDADELDIELGAGGSLPRFGDRDLGEVDSRDLPAALGEPESVPAFAAREIESSSAGKIGHLGDEEAVGLGAPEKLRLRVLAVPVLTPHEFEPFRRLGRSRPA